MSLTSHLNDAGSTVRRFLLDELGDTRKFVAATNRGLRDTETLLPEHDDAKPADLAVLGGAYDYLCRWHLPHGTERGDLIAAVSAALIGLSGRCAPLFAQTAALRDRRPIPTRELARRALVFANLDAVYRAGTWGPADKMDTNGEALSTSPPNRLWRLLHEDGITPEGWPAAQPAWMVDDLCRLIDANAGAYAAWNTQVPLLLNPTFDGSVAVGGADADLVAAGTLLDIKATTEPKISRAMLWQVLGYALLDWDDRYSIRRVGLHLPRQAVTLDWSVGGLAETLGCSDWNAARQRFRQMLEG